MRNHPSHCILFGVLALLGLRDAAAQQKAAEPWTVTVASTLNPLPIGLCAAVLLKVVDSKTGEPPRNPQGDRVTMADFDMAVTPATEAFAGQRIDSSHWSICGCPGSRAGETATITATYPSRASNVKTRVPEVALQATATVTTSNAKGATAPAACTSIASANSAPVAGSNPAPAASTSPPMPVASPVAPAPAVALAPVSPTLTVVVKKTWDVPFQSTTALPSGTCAIVLGSFTDAAIRLTDAVVVTGQGIAGGNFLKWTAVVDPGEVRFNVCNYKPMTSGAETGLYLDGRRLNIVVLR